MTEDRIWLTIVYCAKDVVGMKFVFDVIVSIRRHYSVDKVRGNISVVG